MSVNANITFEDRLLAQLAQISGQLAEMNTHLQQLVTMTAMQTRLDQPSTSPATTTPSPAPTKDTLQCPNCNSPMIKRFVRGTGAAFWGCSKYPECRGTRSIPTVPSTVERPRSPGDEDSPLAKGKPPF